MRHAFFLSIALGLAAASAHAAPVQDATQALAAVEQAGYVAPYELEFKHGYWSVEATTPEGLRVDVLINPQTGELLSFDGISTALPRNQVRAALEAAGYHRVRDLEFDDGFWEAEANNAQGREVELVLHPLTGAVLAERFDDEGDDD